MLPAPENLISGVAANTDGAPFQVIAAPGSGYRLFGTCIHAINTGAAAVTVDIRNGASGAVLWTMHVAAGASTTISFPLPLGGFSENTAIFADASAATSTLTMSINGFKRRVT